jgi:hypothetical protein
MSVYSLTLDPLVLTNPSFQRYWRRVETALKNKKKYPETAEFYRILRHLLDWKACSGDEEDKEICPITGKNRHIMTTLGWLSEEANMWMRKLDGIDLCRRFPDGNRSISGNFPDPRYDPRDFPDGQVRSERFNNGVIKGLPRNFYDDAWFKLLGDYDREELAFTDSLDLMYPQELET